MGSLHTNIIEMSKNVHGQETGTLRVGLEHDKIGKYIESKIRLFHGPWKVQQFKLGQSNPTFLMIDAKENKCVVSMNLKAIPILIYTIKGKNHLALFSVKLLMPSKENT